MIKSLKYRLYPNNAQKALLNQSFGCMRKLWNLMLEDRIAYYQATHQILEISIESYFKDYPYLQEVDYIALSNVLNNLNKAYQRFLKKGDNNHPKFKSAKSCRKSYTTKNVDNQKNIEIVRNTIKVPIIGNIKARIHRLPANDWILRFATLSQDPDGKYYISITFSYYKQITPVSISDKVIGLDYKSDGLYCDSNGNVLGSAKSYRKLEKRLAILQHRLNVKKEGSSNWEKARLKLARIQKRIANQRNDYLHKESRRIADNYDAVCCETLNMKEMANRDFGIGKSTLDNGYGLFLYMLEYKLNAQGKRLVKINRWYPSTQICSRCGRRQHLPLQTRVFRCSCGLEIDRDYNSALNIKREGLKQLHNNYRVFNKC